MKKIIFRTMLLLTLTLIVSCNDNEDSDLFEGLTNFTWWVSPPVIDFNIPDKTINLNKYLVFKDLSKGFTSHKWEIKSGGKFISTNFVESDTIYTDNLLPNAGTISEESLVAVVFPEVGIHEILLRNTYKDSVIGSVKIEDQWVAEQVFTITVEE